MREAVAAYFEQAPSAAQAAPDREGTAAEPQTLDLAGLPLAGASRFLAMDVRMLLRETAARQVSIMIIATYPAHPCTFWANPTLTCRRLPAVPGLQGPRQYRALPCWSYQSTRAPKHLPGSGQLKYTSIHLPVQCTRCSTQLRMRAG